MSERDKKGLMALGQRLNVKKGEPVFLQGDSGGALYFIQSGSVTISTASADGREMILQLLSAGDFFGEIALFDREARTASAFSERGAVLVAVDREDVLHFLDGRPELYRGIIHLLCHRLRWSSKLVESLAFDDSMTRLVTRLIYLASSQGDVAGVTLKMSQEHLAKMLGLCREIVNKNLQELQDRGLVTVKRGTIEIPDVEGLLRLTAEEGPGWKYTICRG